MKKVIHTTLHWIKFGIIFLVLILVLLSAILRFITPYLESHRHDIEEFVSKTISQPVQIGHVSVGNRFFEPVLVLSDVNILNDSGTESLLQVKQMEFSVDLIGSLVKWQIRPGLLVVKGSEISIYQNKDGTMNVSGIPTTVAIKEDGSKSNEMLSWLFDQSRIYLKDLTLNLQLTTGRKVKITGLYLRLYNWVLYHDLDIDGKISQEKSLAEFKAKLKMRGRFSKNEIPYFTGDITLNNWIFDFEHIFSEDGASAVPAFGEINLIVKKSTILSQLFRQPLPVKNIRGKVAWRQNNKGFDLSITKFSFADEWLKTAGSCKLFFPTNSKMPVADMRMGIKLANLAKAKLYYPAIIMPPNAVQWLDAAFASSKQITGNMVLQGPLDKFPFDNNEGRFLVDTNINDVQLDYDPDWPPIKNITGKMIFANRSMTIIANAAKILGAPTGKIKTVIPDLELPILLVDGSISADAKVGLEFVNLSPLKQTVGGKLRHIRLTGPMDFILKMKMPLSDSVPEQDTDVEGDINLYGNRAVSTDLNLSIDKLRGSLHFHNDDLVTNKLVGEIFDQPVDIKINNLSKGAKDSITQVNIAGNSTMADIENIFDVDFSPYLFGSFDYQILLELHSVIKQDSFKITSSLKEVGVELPSPFGKHVGEPVDFEMTGYFGDNKPFELIVNYNNQINAALKIKNRGAAGLEVLAGEINFGSSKVKVPDVPGVLISGSMAKLDYHLWEKYLTKMKKSFGKAESAVKKIKLNIGELKILGQMFKNVSFIANYKNKGWSVDLKLPNIVGNLFLPNNPKAVVRGRFGKIHLNVDSDGQKILQLKPQDIPSLHFNIDSFKYGDNLFTQVELNIEHLANGAKINKISGISKGLNVDAKGEWLVGKESQGCQFSGKVSSDNVGSLLKQHGLTDNMVGGKGEGKFVLRWPNSPLKPTLKTISGSFDVKINSGRIINLGKDTENRIGFGRVLGLLSLQSLPKRLVLDFSDLGQQGFGFDELEGYFDLSNGKATVHNLDIDGHVAYVKAKGVVDLVGKKYNLVMSMVPKITSSIPVAAALVGGPIVGAITFVADKVVSSAVKKSASYSYRVTGPWSDPQVSKMR